MKFQNVQVQEVFSTTELEYESATSGEVLTKIPWKKILRMEGADAQDFLDRMLSQKIINLNSGEGTHATLLTAQGFMVSDLIVLKFENHFLLICDEMTRQKTAETLNKFIVAEDVRLFDVSESFRVLHFFGKDTRVLLKKWVNREISKLYSHESFHGCHVIKNARTCFEGYDVVYPADKESDIVFELIREGISLVGFNAFNILRVEAGSPWYPFEIGEKTNPLEIHFKDAISYDKQCYIGQETIAKATYRGHPNKVLVGFEICHSKLLTEEAILNLQKYRFLTFVRNDKENEQQTGYVTSIVYSLKLNKWIALGFLKYDFRETNEVMQCADVPDCKLRRVAIPL